MPNQKINTFALQNLSGAIVQWIVHGFPEPRMQVRFLLALRKPALLAFSVFGRGVIFGISGGKKEQRAFENERNASFSLSQGSSALADFQLISHLFLFARRQLSIRPRKSSIGIKTLLVNGTKLSIPRSRDDLSTTKG